MGERGGGVPARLKQGWGGAPSGGMGSCLRRNDGKGGGWVGNAGPPARPFDSAQDERPLLGMDSGGQMPPEWRRTVDNGTEFALHYWLHELGIETFFCDTHSPWQKGGVENAIGRLRRTSPQIPRGASRNDRVKIPASAGIGNAGPPGPFDSGERGWIREPTLGGRNARVASRIGSGIRG